MASLCGFENQAPGTCLATSTWSTTVLSDSVASTYSSEEGWLLPSVNIGRDLHSFCSFVCKVDPTTPCECPAAIHWEIESSSHDGTGASSCETGWEINCAGHLGNHQPLLGRSKKIPGGLARETEKYLPQRPKGVEKPQGSGTLKKCSKPQDYRVTR